MPTKEAPEGHERSPQAANSIQDGFRRVYHLKTLNDISRFDALLAAAADPGCVKLAGLFDRQDLRVSEPNLGYVRETPSLAEATGAALQVLDRRALGFVLMVAGGAVDWASHWLKSGRMIEEQIDFERAVEAVVEWVRGNSNWGETLLIVTGDRDAYQLVDDRVRVLYPVKGISESVLADPAWISGEIAAPGEPANLGGTGG